MRTRFLTLALSSIAFQAFAQTPAVRVHASPADVAAAEIQAKTATRLVAVPLVSVAPYRLALEFRSKPTPASLHEKNNELINVLSGSGTLIVGGALKEEQRRDESNLVGNGIDGGQSFALVRGTYFLIPAGTAHYFAEVGAEGLTITTMYIPAIP